MFQVEQGHQRMICSADTTTRPIFNVGTFTIGIFGGVLNNFPPFLSGQTGRWDKRPIAADGLNRLIVD